VGFGQQEKFMLAMFSSSLSSVVAQKLIGTGSSTAPDELYGGGPCASVHEIEYYDSSLSQTLTLFLNLSGHIHSAFDHNDNDTVCVLNAFKEDLSVHSDWGLLSNYCRPMFSGVEISGNDVTIWILLARTT